MIRYNFLILLLIPSLLYGNSNFEQMQKDFMWELYNQGRYIEAITEAKRAEKLSKQNNEFFIYANYYLAGYYDKVIDYYTTITPPKDLCSTYLLSMAFLNSGKYEDSYQTLLQKNYSGNSEDFILFRQRVFPLILLDDMDRIKEESMAVYEFSTNNIYLQGLREDLLKYSEIKKLSPFRSAIASAILPGAGQIYSGRISDGIISFISVAATSLAGYYFYKKEERSISYTLFFFSGLFYTGNIYGAYNSAEFENKRRALEKYKSIKTKYGSYTPQSCIEREKKQ
jgi:TM2 domain-containing membrane protein YozV